LIADKVVIQELIYAFYRKLMGTEEPKMLSLDSDIWSAQKRVTTHENEDLLRSFSLEDLKEVLKDTKTDTTPGPDGFPVLFYKQFWPMLKESVLQILNGFALGRVDISRLSLIPKVTGAEDIKQFRPSALINVLFKPIAKAYAMRLSPVAHRTIAHAQTTFIKGRLSTMLP
jgi:hypothetical protein